MNITYVHHDCFNVEIDGLTLLFDFPDAAYRTVEAEEVVRRQLAGTDAVVFFSHSHADHCGSDVFRFVDRCARVRWVQSWDVPDVVDALDVPEAVVIDPDEPSVQLEGLRVGGIESTDLGVGFLLEISSGSILAET